MAKKAVEPVEPQESRWKPTEEEFRRARIYASKGLTDSQIIARLGYPAQSTGPRLRWCPEMKQEIETGRATAVEEVLNALFEAATKDKDVRAMKAWLEGVAGWGQKKVEVEHTGELDVKHTVQIVVPKMLTHEEWQRAAGYVIQEQEKQLTDSQSAVEVTVEPPVIDG